MSLSGQMPLKRVKVICRCSLTLLHTAHILLPSPTLFHIREHPHITYARWEGGRVYWKAYVCVRRRREGILVAYVNIPYATMFLIA